MQAIKLSTVIVACLFLANCGSVNWNYAEAPSGQKLAFVTSKSETFGAAPTTVAMMEERPGSGVYRPVGTTQGTAGESTIVAAIGGGVANGVGLGVASKLTSAATSAASNGSTKVGSIVINNSAVGGGANAINGK